MSHAFSDRDRFEKFVSGQTVLGNERFWMVNFLKFKEGGLAEWMKYEQAVVPLMKAVDGKCVFRLYNSVKTVVDGGGLVPDWDGVFISEYPSPQAFKEFASSDEYNKVASRKSAALESIDMYACDGMWASTKAANQAFQKVAPNMNLDMTIPQKLAANKSKEQIVAISGNQEKFMEYVQDDRFESGRVWMLNLLKLEANNYYAEYAARAQSHTKGSYSKEGSGGGIQFFTQRVFSLHGPEYDQIAIMQYPSRQAFLGYVLGSDRKGNKTMSDGFVLRTAGLAVQGLVCLGPDSDPDAVQDPNGPNLSQSKL
eukprot:gnl/MRDRNA2_/MRDRNA2_202908_c0_seq1.p1 gnl/MRDRNA2_/MRDRNA2_202908_c0~~gnl/MRDRNA2_/MRDRNA2_202908_c0_seq1.p1  ORF type:complete len:311 (+),score=60.49 gnl/MRDRNA2_/MRDRNA2_202908_c0_seq1:70-1002(+)